MATVDGKKTGGRQKGTPNKRTWEARAICERLNFDPLEQLVAWATGDWKKLGYTSPTKTIVDADGNQVQVDRIDEALRQKSTKEVVPYIYPQLKAIEHSGDAGALAAASLAQLAAVLVANKDAEQNTSQPARSAPADGAEVDDKAQPQGDEVR